MTPTHPGSADALCKALEDLLEVVDAVQRANPGLFIPSLNGNSRVIAARAALSADAALSQQGMVEETAWLVESQNHGPCWWGRHNPTLEDDDEFGWTTDSLRAIRFARKEDAEMYIREVGWNDVIASEHMWCGPTQPQERIASSGRDAGGKS